MISPAFIGYWSHAPEVRVYAYLQSDLSPLFFYNDNKHSEIIELHAKDIIFLKNIEQSGLKAYLHQDYHKPILESRYSALYTLRSELTVNQIFMYMMSKKTSRKLHATQSAHANPLAARTACTIPARHFAKVRPATQNSAQIACRNWGPRLSSIKPQIKAWACEQKKKSEPGA